jgi:hypothetical protein
MSTPSKIVFLDIETSPSLGWVWGAWQQDVIEFDKSWHLLSFSYKVLGQSGQVTKALCDYPNYKKNLEDDRALTQDLWEVLNGADIIIGHNLDKFDIKKSNTRFITHGLQPPAPYKTVDTLKIARKVFKFDRNKLDELGRYLGLGRKLATTGYKLWLACMSGDEKAWTLMKKYNAQDVRLLEKVYMRVRPWATNHANVNQGQQNCPKCGSTRVQRRGWEYTNLRKKQRYQCRSCAGWYSGSAVKP